MATRRSPFRKSAVLAGSMALLAGIWTPAVSPVYAALPHLDQIRVGLFMNAGSFDNAVPEVTLRADGGLAVGVRQGDVPHIWLDGTLSKAKFSLDQYRIQLPDTADAAQAKDARNRIAAAGNTADIYQTSRQDQVVYQTAVGPFPTKEAAVAALSALKGNSAVGSFVQTASITGPIHGNAGTYNVQADAENQIATLQRSGVPAELGIREGVNRNPAFVVVIGGAADSGQWSQVKQQATQAVPGLQIQDMPAGDAYLLRRMELAEDGAAPLVHLQLNAAGPKTWVAPKQGRIAITEKSGHTYRGGVELSASNGELAVVNVLPFEQYLYSVVTSEMGGGWPIEALKAQAVAARTYALNSGMKYPVAHVSDTTRDQAYSGDEAADAILAVDATAGEVLTDEHGLISAYFSSNAGGMTASPTEVWGATAAPYLGTVPSPDDGAEAKKGIWKHVVMPDGRTAYVHSDYVKDTGDRNPAGLPVYAFTESGVNVREAPYVDNTRNPPIAKFDTGDRVVVIGQSVESNAFEWIRGPYGADWVAERVNGVLPSIGKVERLEVGSRGPSGRVLQVKANGQTVAVKYPDAYRSLFGSLPSTRFEIEETGRYTIQGTGGVTRSFPGTTGPAYVLRAGDAGPNAVGNESFFVMNGSGSVREATAAPQFVFKGQGYGHGLGMSQWGARGYAELGYDYQSILKFYYRGVSIVKE